MADQDSNKINLPLALSSSTPSWCDLHHHATLPTLSTSIRYNNNGAAGMNLWQTHCKLSSSPCDHKDVSISASNNYSLTIDDQSSHRFVTGTPSNYIIREPSTDNNIHVLSQFLLDVRGSQGMSRDVMGENPLNGLSLKWEEIGGERYPISDTSEFFTDNTDKQSINRNAGYNGDINLIENNDIFSSPTMVKCWSIAPPDQSSEMSQHIVPHPCNIPSANRYLQPDISTTDQTKQNLVFHPQSFGMESPSIFESENSSLNQMRQENDQLRAGSDQQSGTGPATYFASFINPSQPGYRPVSDNWRPREINMLSQHDLYAPSAIDPFSNNSCSKFSNKTLPNSKKLLDACKKHAGTHSNPSMNKGNGRGVQGAFINETKKKRSDDAFQYSGSLKKHKRDNSSSNSSTAKVPTMRTPKGKVEAEKLSALQQIVSPYGKTDTASILQEAIGFIRRHQENVQTQMLSNPYLKSGVNKLQEAWGNLDKKGERNKVLDLKIRGLCLVPISSIPQEIKEDNSGLDYWPSYRGYLYR